MSAPNAAPKLRSTSISSFSGNCSVPLNSMCSTKWATPVLAPVSLTDPASDRQPQRGLGAGPLVVAHVVPQPVVERAGADVGSSGSSSSDGRAVPAGRLRRAVARSSPWPRRCRAACSRAAQWSAVPNRRGTHRRSARPQRAHRRAVPVPAVRRMRQTLVSDVRPVDRGEFVADRVGQRGRQRLGVDDGEALGRPA